MKGRIVVLLNDKITLTCLCMFCVLLNVVDMLMRIKCSHAILFRSKVNIVGFVISYRE